jgi:Fe-S cluster assembly iron-binding protein IscA
LLFLSDDCLGGVMEHSLKIKLSNVAHDELIEMLKLNNVYDSVRLMFVSGCCKTAKVDIYLDNFKPGDIKSNIGDLKILYDETLLSKIKELTIAYKDSRFWIKTMLPEDSKSHCSSSEKKSCSGCSGKCGSH